MFQGKVKGNNPRSVARDIPGIFEAIFPQLVPVTVAHLNRRSHTVPGCVPVPEELVQQSSLQRSMLFEIAVVIAEELLHGYSDVDWDRCLERAIGRQRRYYDARIPAELTDVDKNIAGIVSKNLLTTLNCLQSSKENPADVLVAPKIPGYRWIANGEGDFSIGTMIIEVKCTNKHFSSADYRQIVMYWLLGYISSIEKGATEWTHGALVNPRLNHVVKFSFNDVVKLISADRSKIDLVETFRALVAERKASDRIT